MSHFTKQFELHSQSRPRLQTVYIELSLYLLHSFTFYSNVHEILRDLSKDCVSIEACNRPAMTIRNIRDLVRRTALSRNQALLHFSCDLEANASISKEEQSLVHKEQLRYDD